MDTNDGAISTGAENVPQDSRSVSNESNGRRLKRRNSSISSAGDGTKRPSTRSLTRANTRSNAQLSKEERAAQTPDTPSSSRKPKKRVRFSDPGPLIHTDEGNSTGLTPAVRRTSLRGSESSPRDAVDPMPSTPSGRARRRRSAPTPRTSTGPGLSSPLPQPWVQEFQFPVLRQQLDERTQRRIRRVGLSEEMNSIERGKRYHMKHEKEMLREKDQELASLKEELRAARSSKSNDEEMVLHGTEVENSTSRGRIVELEEEVRQLRAEIATSGASQNHSDEPVSSYESTDTVLISDSNIDDTILVSTTPDRPFCRDLNSAFIPSPSPTISPTPGLLEEASTPATSPDFQKEAEIFSLSLDLEAAKQEKLELFHEWRSHVSSGAIPSPRHGELSRLSSPPPDFMAQVTATLRAALSRASDATLTLDILREDLSGLGFHGPSANDIIAEMRSRFREARVDLERAVPGETPDASLENGSATLHVLVERIKSLVEDVKEGQEKLVGSTDREKVLRGQFDACLSRYEDATHKIVKLEETIESTADDMLHSRMRIQELEWEGKDQAFGIERLNNALEKYRTEIKELESLITTLESEHNASATASNNTIETLESRLQDEGRARREAESLAEEHRVNVNKLQETLAQNNTQITSLTSTVASLTEDRNTILAETERKSETYDRQTGSLNAKLGELTTSLSDANSRVEILREANIKLEHRLSLEADAFVRATEAIQAENARTFARIKEMTSSSLRGVKVRKANAELEDEDDDDDLSTPTTTKLAGAKGRRKTASFAPIGSEPITPSSGGSRFVDVQIGRGKKRKRPDSGIGILELEEEEEEEEEERGEADNTFRRVEIGGLEG